MNAYIEVGGYSYAVLRAGVAVRNPAGKEVYFQPGDATAAILPELEALQDIPEHARAAVADMALSDYFT